VRGAGVLEHLERAWRCGRGERGDLGGLDRAVFRRVVDLSLQTLGPRRVAKPFGGGRGAHQNEPGDALLGQGRDLGDTCAQGEAHEHHRRINLPHDPLDGLHRLVDLQRLGALQACIEVVEGLATVEVGRNDFVTLAPQPLCPRLEVGVQAQGRVSEHHVDHVYGPPVGVRIDKTSLSQCRTHPSCVPREGWY